MKRAPALLLLLVLPSLGRAEPQPAAPDDLWAAARKGDAGAVEALLARGVEVNAKTRYGATALWFAAYKGQLDVVKALLRHGADVDARDTVWGESPLDLAAENDQAEMVKALLDAGARGADAALLSAVQQGKVALLRAVLDRGRVRPETLGAALLVAPANPPAVGELLKKAGARPLGREGAAAEGDHLDAYAGDYDSPNGRRFHLAVQDGRLIATAGGAGRFVLRATAPGSFQAIGQDAYRFTFERQGERVTALVVRSTTEPLVYTRAGIPTARRPRPGAADEGPAAVVAPQNWPSFRGPHASGVADGQRPPTTWDVEKGGPRLWKTPIPGLAHSGPVVWGDRLFVTTAVSSDSASEFKPGLYGAGTTAKDVSRHRWRVYCLDKNTGKVLWERTACEGVPKVRRHIKSSHANATPATDGKRLVVSFASEGLYGYDLDGNLLWKRDLGVIDVGAFNDPDLQWGAASSPVLYRNLAIVQCDRQKDSFLAAYDADTGKPVWSVPRDEPPSWATPTVYEGPKRAELVVNGTNFIRGYDPLSGRELWRLGRNSQITVPTPVAGHGLIYVTSGYYPIQPIYAVWAGATGDLTLRGTAESSDQVAWSKRRGGPYMPTPLLYGDYLYTCSNNGTVACYEARTGKLVYQERLASGGYSASPVAADGKLYFTSEEGEVSVVRAGPAFELLAVNAMGDACMATPAIADGRIFVRTQHFVFGIGR